MGTLTEAVSVCGGALRRAYITSREVLPPNEGACILANPLRAVFVGLSAPEALTWAQELCTGHGAHNCRADAARHAYWRARITLAYDAVVAEAAATSHERINLEEGAVHNEMVMDLENNAKGRSLAASISIPPGADDATQQTLIKSAVLNAANRGALTVQPEPGWSRVARVAG